MIPHPGKKEGRKQGRREGGKEGRREGGKGGTKGSVCSQHLQLAAATVSPSNALL